MSLPHPLAPSPVRPEREQARGKIQSAEAPEDLFRPRRVARALFACDELCGFLVACALVTPEKSLEQVETSSVRKKMKRADFARNVNREDIVNGAAELGVDLDAHIAFTLDALRGIRTGKMRSLPKLIPGVHGKLPGDGQKQVEHIYAHAEEHREQLNLYIKGEEAEQEVPEEAVEPEPDEEEEA